MCPTSGKVKFDYVKQVSALPPDRLLRFYEVLAHNLTVSVRAIWSDETLTDSQKVEQMKWVNEIMHQIIRKTADLRLDRNALSGPRPRKMMMHWISQCPEIEGDIAWAAISSYQAVIPHMARTEKSLNERIHD
jgi:hypothetical protein